MSNERTHALYRFYDATGTLLYVGITADPGARWRTHAHDKPWWHQVANITVETHPDRAAVLDAERAAIVAENPLHNVVHNRGVRRPAPDPEPVETFEEFWARQAATMPDDCHDRCVPAGILSVYYPHLWHDGTAHYTCEHGHTWTCSWGTSSTGAAPQNRGTVHERYQGAS